MEYSKSMTLAPPEHLLKYIKIEKMDEKVSLFINLGGLDYKCTILQKNVTTLSEEELLARFDKEIAKMVQLAKVIDLKAGEVFAKRKDEYSLQGRINEKKLKTYVVDTVKFKLPENLINRLDAIKRIYRSERSELLTDYSLLIPNEFELTCISKPLQTNSEKTETTEPDNSKQSYFGLFKSWFSGSEAPTNDDNILNEKVHFIGAVAIPDRSWGGEEGKELFLKKYGLEIFSIWPCDKDGNNILDENNRPMELHIYERTLKSTYEEWANKIDNNLIVKTSEMRFDEYVAQKMLSDPEFKKMIEHENVRYLKPEELDKVKAHFVNGGLEIQQIGLDSDNNKLDLLSEGDYAFVIGREHHRFINPEDSQMALYLSLKKSSVKGKIQHSSYFRSGKVASAGMMHVNAKGKIVSITEHSGHYLPSEDETATILKFLQKKLDPDYFKSIICNFSQFSGFMDRASRDINRLSNKILNWNPNIGVLQLNAKDWLEKYNISHNIIS